MIIALSDACPIFDASNSVDLHRFLGGVVKRRHIIVSPSLDRLADLLGDRLWAVYGAYFKQSLKLAARGRAAWASASDCSSCNSEHVAEFYNLPLLVVVENARTDGRWLQMVIEELRPRLRVGFADVDSNIDFRQARGVGEIPKELDRFARRVAIRPGEGIPPRLVALCDSDAHTPGRLSSQAREVIAKAGEVGAAVHVLSMRTIENYLPDASLEAYVATRVQARSAFDLVRSLSPHQRDHYPMKNGLTFKERLESELFSQSMPLQVGFGDLVDDLLTNFRHTIAGGDLAVRDHEGDLVRLLDLLEENL